ncbi:MAG: sulfatase [Flavobacteriia bacterium]|nr:MAG: sulfatase [Flavobacteriia bacterium]
MKKINFLIYLWIIIFTMTSYQGEKKNKKQPTPNIIVFLVDDMGWQDTSLPFWDKVTPFNKRYHTPNMERLAKEGMKFTQAYATPVCTPTRVSLMTGMNAARHRVTNWTSAKDKLRKTEKNHKTLIIPQWNMNGLSPVAGHPHAVYATPLPKLLQKAGYYTIHVGKAHFGARGTIGANPLNIGFDVNIGGTGAGQPGSYLGTENYGNGIKKREHWAVPNMEEYYGKDIFLTEALTREAIKAMDTAVSHKEPFFLYMAHYAVHTPIMADQRFIKKYTEMGLDPIEAKYASLIEGMDKSLGDIMDYLQKRDLDKNTIILFMSDNGGLSAVARGGKPHTHNKPLSSGKGSVHEGGIREPMIVKWPGKVKPQTVTDQKVIIEDFYPTILKMAGIKKVKTVQKIDGISFIPILKGKKTDPERALFWHFPNKWGPTGPGIGASSTVRKGDWKLIYYHNDESFELFNIKNDIGEHQNLAKSNPKKLKELAKILSEYLVKVNAQMPVHRNTGKKVLLPINSLKKA